MLMFKYKGLILGNFNSKMNITRIYQAKVGIYSQRVRQLQKTKQFRQLVEKHNLLDCLWLIRWLCFLLKVLRAHIIH